MPTVQLVYASRVARSVRLADVEQITAEAAERNARCGVTGFLLYSPTYFLQVLEGDDAIVSEIFERIQADDRHYGVHVASRKAVRVRSFDRWTMGLSHWGSVPPGPAENWHPATLLELLLAAASGSMSLVG